MPPPSNSNAAARPLRLGLRENLGQFVLLAADNALVGMLVGSERSTVPLLGRQTFHVSSLAVLLAFIVSFGLVKGPLNLVAGRLADRHGRRPVLIAGWLLGLPVPWLLLFAPTWWWVVCGNLLLGANQGLTWTMTVTSKIDLVGPARRGLALGVNEFSGYVGVAAASAATGALAAHTGLRPAPFLLAAAVSVVGLAIALIGIRETHGFTHVEANSARPAGGGGDAPSGVAHRRTFAVRRTLFACSQAGMINKFSDTAVWGLVPTAMAAQGFDAAQVGEASGLYALVWGVAQLATGALSDRLGRRLPIASGLAINAVGLGLAARAQSLGAWLAAAVVMGLGTAMLYPVLLAAVSDVAHPSKRGAILGVYRLWRDGGYALGGLVLGVAAAWLAPSGAFVALAVATIVSAGIVVRWMDDARPATVPAGAETEPSPWPPMPSDLVRRGGH